MPALKKSATKATNKLAHEKTSSVPSPAKNIVNKRIPASSTGKSSGNNITEKRDSLLPLPCVNAPIKTPILASAMSTRISTAKTEKRLPFIVSCKKTMLAGKKEHCVTNKRTNPDKNLPSQMLVGCTGDDKSPIRQLFVSS